jgi:surface protein
MGTTYDVSHTDKAYAHIDRGPGDPGYLSESKEAYALFTPSDATLTFYYDNQRNSREGKSYSLNTDDNLPGWNKDVEDELIKVRQVAFDASFDDVRPTTTNRWFGKMYYLQTITGIEHLNTSEVTDMSYMFSCCDSLTSLDLSHFNTAKVTAMSGMFYGCAKLTDLDLSAFNTSQVTDMGMMFSHCCSLTSLDVSSFNTANVTVASEMFDKCYLLESLDLSSFNTAQVTNMSKMFYDCSALTTIYVGDEWSTEAVSYSDSMFGNCSNLVGGKGTTYDDCHIDAAYAHIDGGDADPGYLSVHTTGDVNSDGEVNISDINAVIKQILSSEFEEEGDVNGDSEVNIADINAIIKIILEN